MKYITFAKLRNIIGAKNGATFNIIRGEVEVLPTGGETVVPGFDPEMFRITPKRIINWGLETEFRAASNARSVN